MSNTNGNIPIKKCIDCSVTYLEKNVSTRLDAMDKALELAQRQRNANFAILISIFALILASIGAIGTIITIFTYLKKI